MGWISDLLGVKDVYVNGVKATPRRAGVNLIQDGDAVVAAADNPALGTTDVTITVVGSGPSLGMVYAIHTNTFMP